MSYKCPQCTKRYLSKSGLRRHVNAHHPSDQPALYATDEAAPHEEPVTDDQDPDDLMAKRDAVHDARSKSDNDDAMIKACKALAIKPADVMSYRVYPDKVVIIEGPVGWKRIWPRDES